MKRIMFTLAGGIFLCAATAATHTVWAPPSTNAAETQVVLAECTQMAARAASERAASANDFMFRGVVTPNGYAYGDYGANVRRACLLEKNWLEVKVTDEQDKQLQAMPPAAQLDYLRAIAKGE